MDADQLPLPRLRRSIRTGDVYIEFASGNGIIDSIDFSYILGCGEYATEADGTCKLGMIRFYSGGYALTRHSYDELCDLICPHVIEDEMY